MNLAVETATVLSQNTNFRNVAVDVGHMSPTEMGQFARDVIDACDNLQVPLKVVSVDAVAAPVLLNGTFANGCMHNGVPILVTTVLNDRVEIVRV